LVENVFSKMTEFVSLSLSPPLNWSISISCLMLQIFTVATILRTHTHLPPVANGNHKSVIFWHFVPSAVIHISSQASLFSSFLFRFF
jgi:hypothetical protein